MNCQKDTANNIKMTGKQYLKKKENTAQFVKKHNKKISGVALVNRIATQRSLCTVSTSKTSLFLKPITPTKGKKQFPQITKKNADLLFKMWKTYL